MDTRREQVVLITGASSGIGKACAEVLSARGHRVYGTARVPGPEPTGYRLLALDVTKDESVSAAVAHVLEREGRIDVLVNNAGIVVAGAVEDTSMDEARMQFDTNFFGCVRMCRAVLPNMRVRRSGLIINMGSIAGLMGLPFRGLYSASKFALEGLTESLRLELRPFGVHVTLLEPGDTRTPVPERQIRAKAAGEGVYAERCASVLAMFARDERNGMPPEHVAHAVLSLMGKASPSVRYTVGPFVQRLATLVKRLVPAWLFERIIGSNYGC